MTPPLQIAIQFDNMDIGPLYALPDSHPLTRPQASLQIQRERHRDIDSIHRYGKSPSITRHQGRNQLRQDWMTEPKSSASHLSPISRRTRIVTVRLFLTNLAIRPHNRHFGMLVTTDFVCTCNRLSLSIEDLRRAKRALSFNLPSPIFAMGHVLVGHVGSPFCCPIQGRVLE